jgi:hypothetical protein
MVSSGTEPLNLRVGATEAAKRLGIGRRSVYRVLQPERSGL